MEEALLDTDILSYYLSGDSRVAQNVDQYLQKFSALNLSMITCYEILSGLSYKQAKRQIQTFENFIQDCNLLNISEVSIRLSAKVSGQLRRNGITIGNSDLLIAGIALEYNLTLITNNEKHFRQIPDLKVGNWK
ncbi:MAG: type II toxin-antitoxin system VapC family toxin [Bacteroidia bacterium]